MTGTALVPGVAGQADSDQKANPLACRIGCDTIARHQENEAFR
jgi:hypothetical protein